MEDSEGVYYMADPDSCVDAMIDDTNNWTLEQVNKEIEKAKSQGYSNSFDETEGN